MWTMLLSANLAVRFALELCMLGALGYWGAQVGDGGFAKVGLAIGAPLLAAVVWGAFLSPRAAVPLPLAARLAIEAAVFGLAALALAAAGHPGLGWALALTAVLSSALSHFGRM